VLILTGCQSGSRFRSLGALLGETGMFIHGSGLGLSLCAAFFEVANVLILCLVVFSPRSCGGRCQGNMPLPMFNFTTIDAWQSVTSPQAKDTQKESKPRILFWNPPNVDARLSASTGCALSSVVEQAGTRALKFVTNLQNFTAQERIEYRALGNAFEQDSDVGTFDYTADLGLTNRGYVVQEYRKPAKGNHMFPAATQEVGLPEMALIFLPNFQKIYNMECEGSTEWKGQTVWVVHFRQRASQRSHLVSLSFGGYPALLKGRAWIAQDSGEVVHMEIGLMREIPEVGVKEWFLSLDYAPVRFRTRDVEVWLPQFAEAYEDSRIRKTIIVHKFSTFQLFSVQTDAVTGSPKRAPQ